MPAHRSPNGEYDAKWHRRRNRPILEVLQPYKLQGTLLEVGCAAGFFLKVAEECGWSVKGIEILTAAVQYARASLQLDVIEGTLEEAGLASASFDSIVMIETVEHLLDPKAVLQESNRLLRPGGAVFVAVPNLNSIMHLLLGEDWSVLSPAEHLYYFTVKTLRTMLEESGFHSIRFFWRIGRPNVWETMNPLSTHRPESLRSRLTKWGTLMTGRWLTPLVMRAKRTDRLMVIAVK